MTSYRRGARTHLKKQSWPYLGRHWGGPSISPLASPSSSSCYSSSFAASIHVIVDEWSICGRRCGAKRRSRSSSRGRGDSKTTAPLRLHFDLDQTFCFVTLILRCVKGSRRPANKPWILLRRVDGYVNGCICMND